MGFGVYCGVRYIITEKNLLSYVSFIENTDITLGIDYAIIILDSFTLLVKIKECWFRRGDERRAYPGAAWVYPKPVFRNIEPVFMYRFPRPGDVIPTLN